MQKLKLHYSSILQGEFSLKELNLLFAFQVNCPGCFVHGFPLIGDLYKEFGKEISFLGLSTAFEDFEFNNYAGTKLLVDRKEMVGVTKDLFAKEGYEYYPNPIDFPIAMDRMADTTFDFEAAAVGICELNPNYSIWPQFEKEALKQRVVEYLKSQEALSLTFTLNQLRGTPSILIFNKEMEVLGSLFGHVGKQDIHSRLQNLLVKTD